MFKKMRLVGFLAGLGILSTSWMVGSVRADVGQSLFDRELQKVRYSLSYEGVESNEGLSVDSEDDITLADLAQVDVRPPEYKSPGRAFLYSLAVPGLGQYYSGSKLKPLLFLAIEVFGLSQAFKYHGNGDDITAEFQQFNRDHWNHSDSLYDIGGEDYQAYQAYLMAAYGTLRPDTLEDSDMRRGFTHILPNERNQQYYEMTGNDVILTVLTDSMELYESRLKELHEAHGPYDKTDAAVDYHAHLLGMKTDVMLELGYRERKRIHNLKYYTWIEQQGKTVEELDAQWYDDTYWENIHKVIPQIDKLINEFNDKVGLLKQ